MEVVIFVNSNNKKNTHSSLRKKGQNTNAESANVEIILEKIKEILC